MRTDTTQYFSIMNRHHWHGLDWGNDLKSKPLKNVTVRGCGKVNFGAPSAVCMGIWIFCANMSACSMSQVPGYPKERYMKNWWIASMWPSPCPTKRTYYSHLPQPRECFVVFHHFHYSRLSRRVMAECVCAWRGKIQRVTTWFTHTCLHTYGPQHHPPNRNLLLQQSCLNSIFSTPFSLWWQSLALRLFSFWPQHFQINSRGITTSSNNGHLRLLWIWYCRECWDHR